MSDIAGILGDRIRQARKAKGLTQAELAQVMETTQESISKWERGEKMPNKVSRSKLQGALGANLFPYAEEEPPTRSADSVVESYLRDLSAPASHHVDVDMVRIKVLSEGIVRNLDEIYSIMRRRIGNYD